MRSHEVKTHSDVTRRRPRAGVISWLAALALACVSAGTGASAAVAAPIADYSVEGSGQPIIQLVPDPSGAMWFVQQISETGNDATSQFRLGRVDDSGQITTFPAQTGRAPYTQVAPDGLGGAWALRAQTWSAQSQTYGGLSHLTAGGTVEDVPMPSGLVPDSIELGSDGNAWLLGCSGIPGSGEQPCTAYSVSPAGKVNSYPLTPVDYEMPTHPFRADDMIVPVADGMWMNPSHTSPGHVAFVTYTGAATIVALESGLEFVGPGPGDDIWWQRIEAASITVGLLSPTGELSAEQTRPADFSFPNAYFTQPGRDGDLLWSDSTPWNESQMGEAGTYTVGGKTEHVIPKWAVSVPHGENFWTGACTFGTQLHQARDGGLWIVSAGHPNMISYISQAEALSTFMPVPSPVPMELGIASMQESTTGALWFALHTESGQTLLARADSLNPPPGLPPYPTSTEDHTEPAAAGHSATNARARRRTTLLHALATAHISIGRLWSKHRVGHVTVMFPIAGRLQVKVTARSGHRKLVLAQGHLSRSSRGRGTIAVRLTRTGKAKLARYAHRRLKVTMTFAATSGVTVRKARHVRG
jgi:hypothetical protein